MDGQVAVKVHWLSNWLRNSAMYMLTVALCIVQVTLYFLRNHIDWTDKKEVKEALKKISIGFQRNPNTEVSEIYLNDENVEYVIRDLVIAEKVSEIASIKEVREFAVVQQRKMGEQKGNYHGWKRYWHSGVSQCRTKNLYDSR
jgi:cytidylate kinase